MKCIYSLNLIIDTPWGSPVVSWKLLNNDDLFDVHWLIWIVCPNCVDGLYSQRGHPVSCPQMFVAFIQRSSSLSFSMWLCWCLIGMTIYVLLFDLVMLFTNVLLFWFIKGFELWPNIYHDYYFCEWWSNWLIWFNPALLILNGHRYVHW